MKPRIVLSLTAILLAASAPAPAAAEEPPPPSPLDVDIQDHSACYTVLHRVHSGDFPRSEAELRDFLIFYRRLVQAWLDDQVASSAKERCAFVPGPASSALVQLVLYPEPASRDLALALLRAPEATTGYEAARSTHRAALAILASLGDPAARLPAERMAVTGDAESRRVALRRLGELGDPGALPHLESVAADSTLADSLFAETARRYPLRPGDDHERKNELRRARSRDEAREVREAARRAIRDIGLAQRGIVVPFDLADRHLERLLEHELTVLPETGGELYELIDAEYPLVTTDAIWRAFMVLSRGTWDELEQLVIRPAVAAWTGDLARAAVEAADRESDPSLRRLAWDNAARIAVAARLLDPDLDLALPDDIAGRIRTEIERIVAAEGIHPSVVLGYEEDYADYRPRSRYLRTLAAQAWSRALTWLGRATWRFDDDDGIRRCLLLAGLLRKHPDLTDRWQDVETLLARWLGPCDDITVATLLATTSEPRAALDDPDRFVAAAARLRDLPRPRVNSLPRIYTPAEGQGVRLLGQRTSPAAEAMQRALAPLSWPPSASAVLERALDDVATADPATEPLPVAGLACLEALRERDPRAPPFMTTDLWRHKQRNTSLAGWAEIEHALAPYLKRAVTYSGISSLSERFHGYVEPSLEFYRRLRALVAATRAELEEAGYFDAVAADIPDQPYGQWLKEHRQRFDGVDDADSLRAVFAEREARRLRHLRPDRARWADLAKLIDQLLDLSQRELAGEPQDVGDALLLRGIRKRLQRIGLTEANLTVAPEVMGFVATVAVDRAFTDECLQLAVGRPLTLLAAIPGADGRRYVCKGPVYSVHAFTRPADDRLSDAAWREQDLFPAPTARVPWLLTQADLEWRRAYSAEDLNGLRDRFDRNSHFNLNLRSLRRWRRQHPEFAGRHVPPELADLLAEVASEPQLDTSVRMHLMEEVTRLSGGPITADHWRPILDLAERDLDNVNITPSPSRTILFWVPQGVPRCGDPALTARADSLFRMLGARTRAQFRELAGMAW